MRRAEVVPDQLDAMDALDHLRRAEVPMLLVHDEYGHFEGIVTPADLLSAIAGEFASDQDIGSEPALVQRDDRSEEHTSELQSLMRSSYAVFCLKKKKSDIIHKT